MAPPSEPAPAIEFKLELVVVPVSDVDRAKAYYAEQLGFHVDVDHRAGEDFRVVQLTPPGSACSITLMRNDAAGSLQGLHMVVVDIEAARAQLVAQGAEVSDYFHFTEQGQTDGLAPGRGKYETFLSLTDPDGNGWLVQEVGPPDA
jgi:catechol 2,3-dioxygenase-like lactoylglutathione lyase family enzyme